MKKYFLKNKFDFSVILLYLIFLSIAYLLNWQLGFKAFNNFLDFLIEMIIFLPAMFVLVGLFDVWLDKQKLQKYISKEAGLKGIFWMIIFASLQAGPMYGAFPVAYLLWQKGAGIRNVFIYLGAFATMKLPMLFFEISFLGFKFSILRTLITLPIFILIAFILEYILKDAKFELTIKN